MLSKIFLCVLGMTHTPTPASPTAPDIIPRGYHHVRTEQKLELDALREHCCVQYTIQLGDSFSRIAQKQLGSSKRFFEIIKLNPKLEPSRLRVGTRIWLPPRDAKAPHQFVYLNNWPGSDWNNQPYVLGGRLNGRYGGFALVIVDAANRDKVAKSRKWNEIVALQDAKKLQIVNGSDTSGLVKDGSPIHRMAETFKAVRNDKGRFTLEHDIRYFDAKGKQIQPEKAEAKAKKDDKGSEQMWLLLLTLGGAGLIAVRMRRRSPVAAQVAIA